MAIGQVRVWLPDGKSRVVPLLEEPRRGLALAALGIARHWVVSDLRTSGDPDVLFDVWVERVSTELRGHVPGA
jgi:hypothetical protein